jgi:hypothetical protein
LTESQNEKVDEGTQSQKDKSEHEENAQKVVYSVSSKAHSPRAIKMKINATFQHTNDERRDETSNLSSTTKKKMLAPKTAKPVSKDNVTVTSKMNSNNPERYHLVTNCKNLVQPRIC